MKKNRFIVILLNGFILGLSACNHNPLKEYQEQVSLEKPEPAKEDHPESLIEAPDTIECIESVPCVASIKGIVPAPGTALVTMKEMPNGGTYDAAKGVFQYTPDYDTVDLKTNPNKWTVNQRLLVSVKSTLDSQPEVTKKITVIVTNKMQAVNVVVTGSGDVQEGSTLEQLVEVKSPDFPSGPFTLTALGAPMGTEITPLSGSSTAFKVKFTPNFNFTNTNHVWSSSLSSFIRSLAVKYNVGMPLGAAITSSASWLVIDVRQAPAITVPDVITQGVDVNFTIRAEDLNAENPPQISVVSTLPFGKMNLTPVTTTSGINTYPTTLMSVKWDQLRAENFGTSTVVSFKVCVLDRPNSFNSCTTKDMTINLVANVHSAPIVDRKEWKSGELKYVRSEDSIAIPVSVIDAEDSKQNVDVKIVSSQNGAVVWNKGTVVVAPKEEGILQFSISATSVYGVKTIENFIVEVLPKSWGKHLLITGDLPESETLQTSSLLSTPDLLSLPYLNDSHSLVLRDLVFVTSAALSGGKLSEIIQDSFFKQSFTLFVSSPLISGLRGKVMDALNSFGVQLKGRFADLHPGMDLSALSLVVNAQSNLQSSKIPTGLKGTLTAASKSPMVLDLSKMSSDCIPLFHLQKPGVSDAVGVRCTTSEGRKIILLGFEMGDVLYDPADNGLLQQWVQELGKGK